MNWKHHLSLFSMLAVTAVTAYYMGAISHSPPPVNVTPPVTETPVAPVRKPPIEAPPTVAEIDKGLDARLLVEMMNDPTIPASDRYVDAYNALHVIPYGESHYLYKYSIEELEKLAEYEAVAALVLAEKLELEGYEGMALIDVKPVDFDDDDEYERIFDFEERVESLYIKAASLSGKPGPLIAFANKEYPFIGSDSGRTFDQIETHNAAAASYREPLEAMAAMMGDPRADVVSLRVMLRQADRYYVATPDAHTETLMQMYGLVVSR